MLMSVPQTIANEDVLTLIKVDHIRFMSRVSTADGFLGSMILGDTTGIYVGDWSEVEARYVAEQYELPIPRDVPLDESDLDMIILLAERNTSGI